MALEASSGRPVFQKQFDSTVFVYRENKTAGGSSFEDPG